MSGEIVLCHHINYPSGAPVLCLEGARSDKPLNQDRSMLCNAWMPGYSVPQYYADGTSIWKHVERDGFCSMLPKEVWPEELDVYPDEPDLKVE